MAIAFDTAAGGWTLAELEDTDSGTTSITGNVPSNVVNGDLMVAACVNVHSTNPAQITLPSGWTAIVSNDGANGTYQTSYKLAYRVANNEPASYSWGIIGNVSDDLVAIFRVTGVHATPLTGTAGDVSNSSGRSVECPAITTGVSNALVVCCAFGRIASNLTAEDTGYPSGMTGILCKRTRSHSNGAALGVAVLEVATAGVSGPHTWSNWYASNVYLSGATFALAPATSTFVPRIILMG